MPSQPSEHALNRLDPDLYQDLAVGRVDFFPQNSFLGQVVSVPQFMVYSGFVILWPSKELLGFELPANVPPPG